MSAVPPPRILGVIAMECADAAPDAPPARAGLRQDEAGALAGLLARDLALLVPAARELDLALAAVHYDPAELLRPDWPLHDRLDALRRGAPGAHAGPRVIAFGGNGDGEVPPPLHAQETMRGGRLRVLPFVLAGAADVVAQVGAAFERELLDLGMAKADTALLLRDAFATKIEHVRYLTLHDLAAMTALQYRNAGLERIWDLLETVLLAPGGDAWLDAVPEPLVRYTAREAHVALFSPAAWRARYLADASRAPGSASDDDARAERLYRQFEARQRQVAAILEAHGVPVTFVQFDADSDPATL